MSANISEIKDTFFSIISKTTGSTEKSGFMDYIGIFISLIIIFMIIYYIYTKLNLNERNCRYMNKEYPNMAPLKSFNETTDEMFRYKLRDYYIKTAYNACCAGGFKNDYVSLCALKNCIKQGARCIDLEVYSVNDEPVIAASSVNNYSIKETYNSVPFSEVVNVISNYAFSSSTSPCHGDPLLLHLRIMSNNKKIYDKMAEILHNQLERRLLGPKYSFENNNKNIAEEPLSNFKGKVIIIADKSNPLFEDTKLDEYINISSSSIFMRKVRFSEGIKFAQDTPELTEFNKKNMTICLPDISTTPDNYSISIPMKYGCQMIGLCYQNYDSNMEFYEKYFNGVKHAFALKPEHLRYKPVTIPMPPAADKKLSYATRDIKIPGGKLNI